MILFCFFLLCGLVQGQVAPAEDESPSFYTPGSCKHPQEAILEYKHPLADPEIRIALFSTENAETEVKTWAADTDYLIKVTSAVEMDLLVGVNGGTLEHVDEGAEACDGAMWYTNARATVHAVAWKSPTCCDFNGTEAQIFVTASKFEHDFLRQQQLFVEASESECSDPALYCSGTKHTETIVTPLPQELAAVAPTGAPTGRTEFIDGSESDAVISPGQGESIPPDGDEDTPVESTKPSEEKPSSSFGYAFLIMLLTIGIALSAVWFYRKYRVRQMQYREFEGLEMRGYAQWSDAAGL